MLIQLTLEELKVLKECRWNSIVYRGINTSPFIHINDYLYKITSYVLSSYFLANGGLCIWLDLRFICLKELLLVENNGFLVLQLFFVMQELFFVI